MWRGVFTTLLVFLLLVGASAQSACWYVTYPFAANCNQGTASYDWTCQPADSIVWYDGSIAWSITRPPGSYGFNRYWQGQVVESDSVVLCTHGLNTQVNAYGLASPSMTIPHVLYDLYATWNWCDFQDNMYSCCGSWSATSIVVKKNSSSIVATYTADPFLNFYSEVIFLPADFGSYYEFEMRLPCDTLTFFTDTIKDCANMTLNVQVDPDTGAMMTGRINVLNAIPDTTAPYVPASPVLGQSQLTSLATGQVVGSSLGNPTASVLYDDLEAGCYELSWWPSPEFCTLVRDTICVQNSGEGHQLNS